MKNLMLRVSRTFSEELYAPEYAQNHLAVELSHPDGFTNAQELSIRVYSDEYRFLGCDARELPRKNLRKVRFDICSDEVWGVGLYRIYVYRNGRPMGWALLELYAGYERWDKAEVEDFQTRPEERYFAEKFCFLPLFDRLIQEGNESNFIRQFIELFHALDSRQLPVPHLLVTGDQAHACAIRLLAFHFCEKRASSCYRFSLRELLNGSLKWPQLQQKISQKKVVVMEVPYLTYSDQDTLLVDLLGQWLEQNASSGPRFIFYGLLGATCQLRTYSEEMERLFTEQNTIYTPDRPADTDPDEENPSDLLALPFDEEDILLKTDNLATEGIEAFKLGNSDDLPAKDTAAKEPDAEQALQEMVGLTRLKEDLEEARLLARFTKKRQELGLDTSPENRHHMLFLGNPGTGKTTVAKLIGQMYHQMGLLSVGHTVETCRTNLVGEFIGETEKKTREAIQEARGGVLFIDEAYTLVTTREETKDFGKEVIHALLPVLSEPNPDLIVILAGYEEKMQLLMRTNPGLQDRFPLQFHFDDYTADELREMAHRYLEKRSFQLTPAADEALYRLIVGATDHHDAHFGNGRWVHNLIEQGLIKSMARRIMSLPTLPDDTLLFRTIEVEDVQAASRRFCGNRMLKLEPQPTRRIGFRA